MREACAAGDVTAVQRVYKAYWLDQPAEQRMDNEAFGAGGLCKAIEHDDVDIAHFLLSKLFLDLGYDINTYISRMDPPALALAITDLNLTKWFLSHGADLNARCGLAITPLSIAVRDAPFEIIQLFFDHGGSVKQGQLLNFAAKRLLPDRLDVLDFLLDKRAPINQRIFDDDRDSYNQEYLSGMGTPLHSAARVGHLDIVIRLISRGADPLIKDSYGKIAIEEAEYVVNHLRSLST